MAIGPQLQAVLNRYGLSSLATWASNALIFGYSEDQIMLELYDQPAFIARFPAIKAREKAGLDPLSPEDYLNFEAAAHDLSKQVGYTMTKKETDDLLANGTSAVELQKRFDIVNAAVMSDTETRQSLQRIYGVSQNDLIRYWMNPKVALSDLQTKYRTGEIAGAALRAGYGDITRSEGEMLAHSGLDQSQAIAGFGELVKDTELFQAMTNMEQDFSRASQLEFLTGSASAAGEVEKRAEQRKGEFEAGGGFTQTKTGFAVGSAE